MSSSNKSYRIRTSVGSNEQFVNVDFTQNFEKFEILSMTINQSNSYRLMNSNTGLIAGRVLANGGFGIPNAKLSVFIEYDNVDIDSKLQYHFNSTRDTDDNGIKYNLLPSEMDDACKQTVGTFPSKRYLLDNDDVIEVFDKYYKYTTRTNNSGDYMIYGVPTGSQTIHCDIDLSDIGVLSQRPSDMVYKGYNINLFESASKFRKDTNLNSLAQIITQDKTVFVYPFWGDTVDSNTNAAVTRCDIEISYKFEPTCVFLGSVITDTGMNAVSKKCIPSKSGGKMSEMTTGAGTIEIIRKTMDGSIEQFSVQGNEVIDENGIWCYQIPMNLDYVMTDEYGNTIISDNPTKGIATRASVRFRISMHENPADGIARKRARFLVPNNPRLDENDYPKFSQENEVDYEFGSKTKDENFRDLMWNNVYTIKSYIPRIQKARLPNNLKHLGIKMVNHSGSNNPMPYNKLNIKFNFMYMFICVLIKTFVFVVGKINTVITGLGYFFYRIAKWMIKWVLPKNGVLEGLWRSFVFEYNGLSLHDCVNDTSNLFYINGCITNRENAEAKDGSWATATIIKYINEEANGNYWNFKDDNQSKMSGLAVWFMRVALAMSRGIVLENLCEDEDGNSISSTPGVNKKVIEVFGNGIIDGIQYTCLINTLKYDANVAKLYNCVENQLAQENEVTSFNFENDWINGVLYFPLWYRHLKPKRKFLFFKFKSKDQWCNGENRALGVKSRKLKVYSNCVVKRDYTKEQLNALPADYNTVLKSFGNDEDGIEILTFKKLNEDNCYGYKCHKYGRSETPIYNGFIIEKETMLGDKVYYYKPTYYNKKDGETDLTTLFATDLVLLGSLNSCDLHGIPQFFKILEGTSYQMPPDLLTEDYSYMNAAYTDNPNNTDENESFLIDESTRHTEYTGADWGNLGVDQSNNHSGIFEANENVYDNGGLFYGLTCFDSYTKPKSIINLERICEIGVSLDESQEILKSKLTDISNIDDDNEYTTLTPDGYISYDDIYNPDYRSMFATLNGNFLRTKVNFETGLTEYDLTHQYLDNFDGSLRNIMNSPNNKGYMFDSYGNNTGQKPNYINNYKLETADKNYTLFRFGDYEKGNGKKIYYYQHNKTMTHVPFSTTTKVMSMDKLPKYENSFYFYFGIKEGNTAIDKFYSTYYSDCSKDVNFGKSINYTFVGNDWCSETGGYILFDTNIELPIKITLTSKDNAQDIKYVCENIYSNKFRIGGCANIQADVNYEYTPFVNFDSSVVDKETIKTGGYNIEIIDGNGDVYYDEIDFYNQNTISYEIIKSDFTLSNAAMVDDNSPLTSISLYNAIANNGSIIQSDDMTPNKVGDYIDRPYYGYIGVKNIMTTNNVKELCDRFKITIEPESDTLDGFAGASCIFIDGRLHSFGDGFIGFCDIDETYYFGVPFGNVNYRVTVTELCEEDGYRSKVNGTIISDDDYLNLNNTAKLNFIKNYKESNNTVITYVMVYEGYFKMFINGIDYDIIKNFRTGWNTNTLTFNQNNIRGWDTIPEYGFDRTRISEIYPIEKEYDEITEYISKIDGTIKTVAEYNAMTTTEQDEYEESKRYELKQSVIDLAEKLARVLSGEIVTDLVDNNGVDYITPTQYNWIDNYMLDKAMWDDISYDIDVIIDDGGNVDVIGEGSDKIDMVNDIIALRIDFTKQMIGAFRKVGNDPKLMEITYSTKSTPVRYIIVCNINEPMDNKKNRGLL